MDCIDSPSVTNGEKGQDNEPKSGQKICSECVQIVRLYVFTPCCSSKQMFILVRLQWTNIAVQRFVNLCFRPWVLGYFFHISLNCIDSCVKAFEMTSFEQLTTCFIHHDGSRKFHTPHYDWSFFVVVVVVFVFCFVCLFVCLFFFCFCFCFFFAFVAIIIFMCLFVFKIQMSQIFVLCFKQKAPIIIIVLLRFC